MKKYTKRLLNEGKHYCQGLRRITLLMGPARTLAYFSLCASLPTQASICLSLIGDVKILVLLNIYSALVWYCSFTVRIVLGGTGWYPYFGPHVKSSSHHFLISESFHLVELSSANQHWIQSLLSTGCIRKTTHGQRAKLLDYK